MKSPIAQYAPYLLNHVNQLAGKKVLIIGDIGLDEYVLGQVRRISPEAPVPIVEVENEENRLGLAANVAQNVFSLGGEPILISVVGADAAADQLQALLRKAGVATDHLVVDSSRPTTRKLRVMVQNHHIVRVDYEQKQFLTPALEDEVLRKVKSQIDSVCAVVLQDYAKGVISERLAQEVIRIARTHKKKILADPNRLTPVHYYRGVDMMTPNYDESLALSGVVVDSLRHDSDLLSKIGHSIMKSIESKDLVITRGKEGMRLFEKGHVIDMPTYARQVSDVTGAGDTVIAALALAWGSGFSLENACALANFAAGVVVGKVGCVPCEVEALKDYIVSRTADADAG
jgi:rfaE bifunctional protein kinase chain/domain